MSDNGAADSNRCMHCGAASASQMNVEPRDIGDMIETDILTLDSGSVALHFGPTYLGPTRPQRSVSIIAEEIEDDDSDRAGHVCSCGAGPHEKGTVPCRSVVTLGSDDAIKLATMILRVADPI